MVFDIITIFPKIFDSFLEESFIKKAQEKGLIKIRIHNLRDFTTDKHRTVDDKPYGGGLGMVLKVEPIVKALRSLTKFKIQNSKFKITSQNSKIILFTPRGRKFNQKLAYQLSKLNRIIMICGRYEGVDERVAKYIADLQLSIGPYDLMGGELPAMVVIETITRLIPGVIGKPEFLKERVFKKGFVEYPQYTRPEVFSPKKGVYWKVPKVLLSGNHKKIQEWREKRKKIIE
jgi:tRNA (guanine37-N1)-methyltransferase